MQADCEVRSQPASTSALGTPSHTSEGDARQRRIPTLSAPFLSVRETPGAGYGAFATGDIPAGTRLLLSHAPAAYVVYRPFRKEVCACCFRYERGRNWKVKISSIPEDSTQQDRMGSKAATTIENSNGGGMVFCTEACRDVWVAEYGAIGVEAYAALEGFVQKQLRGRGWSSESDSRDLANGRLPSSDEIDQIWRNVNDQAHLIRSLRLPSDLPGLSKAKAKKQAYSRAMALQIPDTDLLYFILSGLLCAHSSDPTTWNSLLMLNPSCPYSSVTSLYLTANAYLQLLATLPLPLISENVLNQDTIEAIISRDTGNSFGIWSTPERSLDFEGSYDSGVEMADEEDPEMLGYGIWPSASFFNHSCSPNVSKRRYGRKWVFSAPQKIQAGSELCITYIRGEEETLRVEERRKKLESGWGFMCLCKKCVSDSELS